MTTQISPRAVRHMEIAARRLARAEATGSGREILGALFTLATVARRFDLDLDCAVLSGASMGALYKELAPQVRYGFSPSPAVDNVDAQLVYYGEAIVLRHNGVALEVLNGDAAEA